MSISNEEYSKMVDRAAPSSPAAKNCVKAFLFGGAICCFGELLFNLYSAAGLDDDRVRILVPVTLIVITAILTATGIFDKIARHAGAGTIVPITGFANSVVSCGMEHRNEGEITGVGTNIFTIAGPVILYGTGAAFLYGIFYLIIEKVTS